MLEVGDKRLEQRKHCCPVRACQPCPEGSGPIRHLEGKVVPLTLHCQKGELQGQHCLLDAGDCSNDNVINIFASNGILSVNLLFLEIGRISMLFPHPPPTPYLPFPVFSGISGYSWIIINILPTSKPITILFSQMPC